MSLFTNGRKRLGREAAQRLIAGHMSLVAFWALQHAGVLKAMAEAEDGLEPGPHAAATNMAPETLEALLKYLTRQEFFILHDGRYRLAPVAEALLESDDGIMDHLYAHQGVLEMLEHLLAKLKMYGHGINRKYDTFMAAQSRRFTAEVFPAIEEQVRKQGSVCILDLNCGTGELLVELARNRKDVVGVGICPDGVMVRQANALMTEQKLDKRLIAVPASSLELCTDAAQAFDRAGISGQLWRKFDCVLAVNFFGDQLSQHRDQVVAALKGLPRSFPLAAVLVAEPCAGPGLEKNYYSAEFELLATLTENPLRTAAEWAQELQGAGLKVEKQMALATDGVQLFVCPPRVKAAGVKAVAGAASR